MNAKEVIALLEWANFPECAHVLSQHIESQEQEIAVRDKAMRWLLDPERNGLPCGYCDAGSEDSRACQERKCPTLEDVIKAAMEAAGGE